MGRTVWIDIVDFEVRCVIKVVCSGRRAFSRVMDGRTGRWGYGGEDRMGGQGRDDGALNVRGDPAVH